LSFNSERSMLSTTPMYDYPSLIQHCQAREQEEKKRGIEIGSKVLSRLAGRLERDFYPKYQDLAWQFSRRLRPVSTIAEFDDFHRSFVQAFRETVKSRSGTIISYGEAQQPVNVFLKEYVEKSGILNATTSSCLKPFLHVTLDGVVIYYLQSFFREDYLKHIAPLDNACGYLGTGNIISFQNKDLSQSQLNQMMFFDYKVYCAWQGWFRQIFPSRPVLLDAIWSIARQTLFPGIGARKGQESTVTESLVQYALRLLNLDRT
jgi:hypothetical protein